MQDRYVGDVGDFAKYALLRRLTGIAGEDEIRLGVIWCLHPDEVHNGDGRHVSYLHRPEFVELDAELGAALRKIVLSGRRSVSAVAHAGILPFRTVFCDGFACGPTEMRLRRNDRMLHRSSWLGACLELTTGCKLVFFDPDNGLEIASVQKHHAKAGKYIYWDELSPFWSRGQALLIYHHLNRTKPAADQIALLTARLQATFDGAAIKALVFRRGSCRVFWLVCPRTSPGSEIKRRADAFLSGGWLRHFQSFD